VSKKGDIVEIWKYGLDPHQPILMQAGAKILTVQVQAGRPYIWALVDIDAPQVLRTIETYGTGYQCAPCIESYIGSFQLDNGALVFHAFDLGEQPQEVISLDTH